jgi:TRAP-type C4-dicarboxylate transport system permease small subunit
MTLLADRLLRLAAVLLVLALLATVTLGVVFRQIGNPLVFSDELAQYLLVWTGFTGWMIAGRRRSHIRITVIANRLPGPARRALEVAIQTAVLVLAVAMVWYGPSLIARNIDIEWVSLPLSAAILYLPVPIAGAALAIESLAAIGRALTSRTDAPVAAGEQPL